MTGSLRRLLGRTSTFAFASLIGAFVLTSVVGCEDDPGERTPEATLFAFLSAMEQSEHDGSAREVAFSLLCAESREALRDRARRASALAGRDVPAWEMIAQGRFRLRLDPRRASMETNIEGERATVAIAASARHAEVELRREDGTWQLVL